MSEEPNYLLASKAFGASGHTRGPSPISGMAAVADARREFNRFIFVGFSAVILIVSVSVSVYALRDKINYQFRQHGIKIQVWTPAEVFADQSDGRIKP